jgi:hypothetical protein
MDNIDYAIKDKRMNVKETCYIYKYNLNNKLIEEKGKAEEYNTLFELTAKNKYLPHKQIH